MVGQHLLRVVSMLVLLAAASRTSTGFIRAVGFPGVARGDLPRRLWAGQRSAEGWAPPGLSEFRRVHSLIEELRADRTAVVDWAGSHALYETGRREFPHLTPTELDFQALVSLMLSSQTKDTVNAQVMKVLREHGLTIECILATPDEQLNEMISPVGFHNRKTKYIKDTAVLLRDRHGGQVPDSLSDLLALPGVGPKMALLALQVVHGRVEGISVDTHVHRISNALGWSQTARPEQTRKALESWIPRQYWPDLNLLIVGLGQESQTEKPKLRKKCLECSRPQEAMELMRVLGVRL
uniref:DNA-(apurinic or apyrimidinic site) lyase n=1 Tax=Rhizochromulina marina TaxID=1034831 RepID=A0A7S2S0Y1_9STRA|mmetsp:Transcript_23642/g.69184  ORF Transcript_23642/g.69184 Transcript_23642/m.69184 type:complete len:295 (+) Transcript_23642:179-1063(+)